MDAVHKLAAMTGPTALVVGYPEGELTRRNAAALCAHGKVLGVYGKHRLPNYAVFDEQRYFVPEVKDGPLFEVNGATIGLSICEDAWDPSGPILSQARAGADVIVNINASPYFAGRIRDRELMLAARAREAHVPIVYVNLVGGQDELVFDGASMVVDARGSVVARAQQFAEDLLVVDVEVLEADRQARGSDGSQIALPRVRVTDPRPAPTPVVARLEMPRSPLTEIYEALVLGTRDYVRKNGFTDVLIGLSGGIDSSLVAAVAVDALGAEHVLGVLMPSRYSTDHSISDAEALVAGLGIRSLTIPIEPVHAAFGAALEPAWSDADHSLADENLQARIRGTMLMSISNTFGSLVLTTGNKSEYATGYTTLYGDMAGGFAVLKDVLKTTVFALCRDLNERRGREVIPETVIAKPPSAELRPDQRDE
jgi:NAD+ synthase (glutamine-hydrolysing)